MEATELRIGNFVYVDKVYLDKVTGLNSGGKIFSKLGYFETVEPIPLTEDWLLKFGFEKNTSNEMVYIGKLSFDLWFDNTYTCVLNSGHDCIYLPHIKHVHQLQNLYFALTGEDLKTSQ